jgi:hypothetical protein
MMVVGNFFGALCESNVLFCLILLRHFSSRCGLHVLGVQGDWGDVTVVIGGINSIDIMDLSSVSSSVGVTEFVMAYSNESNCHQ